MKSDMKKNILRDSITASPWQTIGKPEVGAATNLTEIFDTVIIGAGITGITTALMLQQAGQKCIVLEAGNVGYGTTGGTSAHLNTFFDTTYPQIESDFSKEAAKLVAQTGKEAMGIIKGYIDKYQADCDFECKDGYLYSENERETKELKEILESSAEAGVEVEEASENGVTVPFESVIRFGNQAQFHPMKYLATLAKAFTDMGGIVLENAFVTNRKSKDGLSEVVTDKAQIKGRNVVYATHLPPGITAFSLRCAPYRSYVIGARLKNEQYPGSLTYDMQEPYHYFRTHEIEGQKYLIVGGEDHKTGHDNPEEAFANLESYLRQYYEVESIDYRWSSQYYVPVDGLPYIGSMAAADEQVYIATGFNGNGMIFGTISGKIISDQILGIENPYSQLYSPSRLKPIAGFSEFVKENADVAWRFVADRFGTEELEAVADLKPGEGKVVEFDGDRLAVYKDAGGKVTALSPVCTHAGCIVNFNAAEKSWDCPCHGGRFDTSGKVLCGPPQKDLEQVAFS